MKHMGGLSAAVALGALLSADADGGTRPLTIEAYSRDWAKWVGMSPDRPRWSPDGKAIYFDWNPERADVSSLYAVDPTGGAPRRVPAEQMSHIPQPPPGRGSAPASVSVLNRDQNLMVWERDGDVFLLDVASSRVRLRIERIEVVDFMG